MQVEATQSSLFVADARKGPSHLSFRLSPPATELAGNFFLIRLQNDR